MPRLIVNADDFGYTPGVNQAIVELHRAGALSSTTLMATGAALDDAIARTRPDLGLRASPTGPALGIGCHVVLVDGVPALPADQIPSLLAKSSAEVPGEAARSAPSKELRPPRPAPFRSTLGAFVADLLRGHIREAEIEREAVAQIRLLQARGIPVTHLDTHKHTHMFPGVLRPLLRAALACGVRAVRNPFEPAWSVALTRGAPLLRRAEVRLLSRLRPTFTRLVAQAGLRTTAGALGVLATGTLDAATLERLLGRLLESAPNLRQAAAEPVWELVCHPGYKDAALATQTTRLRAEREAERSALAAAASRLRDFTLIHFGQLSD